MKNFRELSNLSEYKKVNGIPFYNFDTTEMFGRYSFVTVTVEKECVQVSVHGKDQFPTFEECVRVKQMLFDDNEYVFLILKNLRLLDNKNLEIRMFYSEPINEQARKMDFEKAMENSFFLYTKNHPMAKIKKQIGGHMVNISSMENDFPSLELLEEEYRYKMDLPLVAIKEPAVALNPKHMIFTCEGAKLKLPKFLESIGKYL